MSLLHGDHPYTERVRAFCSAGLDDTMVAVERNSWCLIGAPPEWRPAGSGGKGNQTASAHHRWLLRLVGSGRALRESESPEGLRVPGAGFCSVRSARGLVSALGAPSHSDLGAPMALREGPT